MIRILQCVNNMHRAGLETMLMNYYRSIDREKIQFDFLVHRQERADYDDEIEQLGGRIFRAPRLYPQNYPAYFAYMKRFFREHPEYKIMHSHIDAMSYLPLLAGKMAGVPVRIAHSHNTSIDRDVKYWIKQGFRHLLPSVATHYFACGEKAGEFLFRGKNFEIIPNAIDGSKFYYDIVLRSQTRKEMNLEGKFVIGHVGRFSYQKNHEFLIDVFEQLHRQEQDSVLMLVGTGEKEKKIREYVAYKNLSDVVLFMGNRSDVNELYQAMDVFVMPSLFEGVPLVGIEAQFAGLPCLFSDRVPSEVKATEHCCFVSLECSTKEWAQMILQSKNVGRFRDNKIHSKYDLKHVQHLLEAKYMDFVYATTQFDGDI